MNHEVEQAWTALRAERERLASLSLRQAFAADPGRALRYRVEAAGITLDYSRNLLDDAALDAILANIASERARLGDRWPGIYAGREHFIYNDEQDSAALAWFKEFEKRDDGLWAKADGLTVVADASVGGMAAGSWLACSVLSATGVMAAGLISTRFDLPM